ncbi:MAG: hypothetical protein ACOWW1_03100 [archaeon]|nr:hypothetical protein [Candidatus Bathyarchaeum sp.]
MNDYLFQLSILMVSAGIMWSLLGKNKIAKPTNNTPKKGWSIKGQESFALIVLGFVLMVVAMYI